MNTRPPANPPSRARWTLKDQSQLDELTERKERIMRENRAPVIELVLHGDLPGTNERLVDWLIANADAVRDALEPFDSGARPGP